MGYQFLELLRSVITFTLEKVDCYSITWVTKIKQKVSTCVA